LSRKSRSVSLVLIGTAAFLAACDSSQRTPPPSGQTSGTAVRRHAGSHFWMFPWFGRRSSPGVGAPAAVEPTSARPGSAVSGASGTGSGVSRGGLFSPGTFRGGFGGAGRVAAGG
jgi:hypothetical protein